MFVEADDSFKIGLIGDLQSVATREDSPIDLRVPWWNDTAKRFDTVGNDYITIDTSASVVTIGINSTDQLTVNNNGIALSTGVSVNEISDDTTLADDSSTALVTEHAVKTYVDSKAVLPLLTQFVSSDSTAVAGDAMMVDTTAGIVNIELFPSLDGQIVVKKTSGSSNNVVVTVSGGRLIDGSSQKSFNTENQSYWFISDGIDFYII
jgi:hypothetical protein